MPPLAGSNSQISLAEDEGYWHGWYARNNGTIGFLGDHTAGESGWGATVLSSLLLMLPVRAPYA